jgi:hypothetical protein
MLRAHHDRVCNEYGKRVVIFTQVSGRRGCSLKTARILAQIICGAGNNENPGKTV